MKEIVRNQTKKYFDEEIYFERAYCLLKIHSNILGFVIGDRGRTINMIYEKTGASIDIERNFNLIDISLRESSNK